MIKNLIATLNPVLRLVIILSYPLFVLVILGWFLIPYTHGYLKEIIAFLLLTLIFVALTVLVLNKKWKQWISLFSYLLLSFLCFIKISFYYNYGQKLSASTFFVIFETHATEASDFLSYYLNTSVIGILLLLISLFFLAFIQLRRFHFNTLRGHTFLNFFCVFGIILSLSLIYNRFSNENILIKSCMSYEEYTEAKVNLKADLAQETSPNITVTTTEDIEQTYVVVIGESTSRWHMQLYGYERNTNPSLTKMKDELLVYNDVITPNTHTIIALDKLLTLSDFKQPNIKNNASIVQLANEAGFTTYWISNQKAVGIHETIPTLIASAASEKYFLSGDDSSYNIHDGVLLPVLDKVLAKQVKKKLIFMHLIGCHSRYNRRYPETYNFFKENKTNARFKSDKALTLINEYDNSILYNDFVVSEIIKKVKNKNTNSYVLYFADHGDEVYDTMDLVGHNEYHATSPMYEVPFLVWLSSKYKLNYPSNFNTLNINKPYILEDLIHSFSQLSHVSFRGFNPEKSLFNTAFKPKIRYIKEGEIYDER